MNKNIPFKAKQLVESNMYNHYGDVVIHPPLKSLSLTSPIIVDLFCGLGGLSLGFEMAGFQTALGLDIHKPSIETFRRSHPTAVAILGDIKKIVSLNNYRKENVISKVLKDILENRTVDVLMAGIPCQGFSLSNRKRDALDERNYLFVYFMKVAEIIKPKYILIENVSGLKSMSNGHFVTEIEESIKNLDAGYRNVTHRVLNALDFGVPQIRKRIIFLGSTSDYKIHWPSPICNGISKPFLNVGDAISDLPRLNAGESANEYLTNSNLTDYRRLMRKGVSKLFDHQSPKHPNATVKKIGSTKPGEPIYPKYTQRIRLSFDKPSPTQLAGGIRPQYQFGHPIDARGLTVRERCRIQSIPDRIRLYGGTVQGRVQTGNAVPPLLAKAIAQNVYFELNKYFIRNKILTWWRDNQRNFPWRSNSTTPYDTLVSEIMLRKTRAENIVEIYQKFISNYPNPQSLSRANKTDIEKLIKPLGLYKNRTKAFLAAGKIITEEYNGVVPQDTESLEAVTHIGRYIANATVMFGYNVKKPLVDENIQRIFFRVSGIPTTKEIHRANYLWRLSDSLFPNKDFKRFTWALLDFSALICKVRNPTHKSCPIKNICISFKKD